MSGLALLLNAIGYLWAFFNLMLLANMLATYKFDPTMTADHKATLYGMVRDDPIAIFVCTLIFPALFFYALIKDEE